MSLRTHFIISDPVNPGVVWEKIKSDLAAHSAPGLSIVWTLQPWSEWDACCEDVGEMYYETTLGQGLGAWTRLRYHPDGPIVSHDERRAGCLEISWDTGRGFEGEVGELVELFKRVQMPNGALYRAESK
jgi:hypothetical protein